MKKLVRVMRDPCIDCAALGHVVRRDRNRMVRGTAPCQRCEGRGFVRIRCSQCWKWQPVNRFIGAKGGIIKKCDGCRAFDTLTPVERSRALNPRAKLRSDAPLRVSFVLRSGNRKTGPIPVTMTSARTCPRSCALYGKGCCAEGHIIAMHWRRLNDDGLTWSELCDRVRALPDGQLWRHNEAGDLPGDDGAIDMRALAELVLANGGKRGFTYTHKPLTRENVDSIRGANDCGFVVNISTDSLTQADACADMGFPVVTVLPERATHAGQRTPAGRVIVVCPAVLRDEITCSTCKLCAVGSRKSIVGFPAHGDRKAQVSQRLRQLPMFTEARP